MDQISVKFLGLPEVEKNNEIVAFPFKKAEALFFYLFIKKSATREELLNLLWGNLNEASAKSNLRNALYVIRKSFNLDIIRPDQKQTITINEKINIKSDIELFLNNANEIDCYKGEFLKEFYVNDSEEYEQWLLNQREYYSTLYVERLQNKLNKTNKADKKNIENTCRRLIESDKYVELPYKTLMELYLEKRQYNNSIMIYKKLVDVLQNDLNILPSKATQDIYNKILKLKNIEEINKNMSTSEFFYGRENEVNNIVNNINNMDVNQSYKSIFINGEAGIGKTKLINRSLKLIDQSKYFIFKTECYYDESDCILKPWNFIIKNLSYEIEQNNSRSFVPSYWVNNLIHVFPFLSFNKEYLEMNFMENISDINFQVAEETLSSLLNSLAQLKKIIIVFDDMQWIDKYSLNLLMGIILKNTEGNIIFIGSSRNEYVRELDCFLTLLSNYNKLNKITLDRFNREQVFELIELQLPEYRMTYKEKQKVFEETEGNAYFLVEALKCIKENNNYNYMSTNMKDFIKTRLLNITGKKRDVLNIISLFFEGAELEIIAGIANIQEELIIDIIEELGGKSIIEQDIVDNIIIFKYSHHKMRKYIYDSLSHIKKRVLHEKAGEILENKLSQNYNDVFLYSTIMYHYEKSQNQFKYLEYTLLSVKLYMDFNHELFPKHFIPFYEKSNNIFSIKHSNMHEYLLELETMIYNLELQQYSINKILKLKIIFNLIKGRHLIRLGEYAEGVKSIEKVIEDSACTQNLEYELLGRRQMIYYYIQINNKNLMRNEIKFSQKIAKEKNNLPESAALLRLKGINAMMFNEYAEAESLLKESICCFEKLNQTQNIYSLNIAACYNYLGEIKRLQSKFVEALEYYEKALEICKVKRAIRGKATFYTNAGRCLVDNNEFNKGEIYIKNALNLYEKLNTLSGRAIALSLMALINVKKQEYDVARQQLKAAEKYGSIQSKAFELGVLSKVQYLIRLEMSVNQKLNASFASSLKHDLDYYFDKTLKYFAATNEVYESKCIIEINNKTL